MIESLYWLSAAHALGDLGLQTAYIGAHKAFNPLVMLAHCLIWSGCVCVALKYLGKYATWKALFLLAGHMLIDYGHIWIAQGSVTPMVALAIDQGMHLVQLVIVNWRTYDTTRR